MDDEWDSHAATWDHDKAARAYAQAAFGSLQASLADRGHSLEGARVCDFGCGTGLLTELLVDSCECIDAVDSSGAMLDVLRAKIERYGWTDVQPATGIPSTRGSHDLVVCSSVCAFLDDYAETVEQLVSCLKPDGLFVQWDWERSENQSEGHGLSRGTIRRALTGGGLTAVAVDTGFDISVDGESMKPLMGIGQRPRRE